MHTVDALARREIAALRDRIARLEGGAPNPPISARMRHLVGLVAQEFGVAQDALLGESRQAGVVLARQVVMAIAHRTFGHSLKRVGRMMQRDHSTVLHGAARIMRMAADDHDFAARVDRLSNEARLWRDPLAASTPTPRATGATKEDA
jgi:chromosomal replication initiation ATPase DnaA